MGKKKGKRKQQNIKKKKKKKTSVWGEEAPQKGSKNVGGKGEPGDEVMQAIEVPSSQYRLQGTVKNKKNT